MKKILNVLLIALLCVTLAGCGSKNDDPNSDKQKENLKGTVLDSKVIESMKKTTKVVIKGYDNKSSSAEPELITIKTITDKGTVDEIVEIISRLVVPEGEGFNCDGNAYYLEMYNNKNDLIDTIYVWNNDQGMAIPKSMLEGCNKMKLSTKDANALYSIIK